MYSEIRQLLIFESRSVLYSAHPKIVNLDCAKTPKIDDCKWVCIELILDDQVFFAPREIFDKARSKQSVPNDEPIVSNYG
jgi:hypothetical protein